MEDQTRKYLADNITGLSAEEAAVAAFLSLRLGELEKEEKAEPARSARHNLPRRKAGAQSMELLHN